MTAWPGLVFDRRGEVRQRLGEALSASVDEAGVQIGLLPQLLLEQRVQHNRADTSVRQPPDTVDCVRQRRRRRYERVAQLKAHVVGRELHQ
jgi:hypothetical protein